MTIRFSRTENNGPDEFPDEAEYRYLFDLGRELCDEITLPRVG
jgi:hypothetical protein